MDNLNQKVEPPDVSKFEENVHKFPLDELLQYAGLHIAWSLDATRILASGEDLADVEQKLRAMGIDPGRVVHDYIPPADVSQF